jgi:hypothetical protein
MAYRIQIFCESSELVSFSEIGEFIDEGSYFDDLKISSNFETSKNEQDQPKNLEIIYENNSPPIILTAVTNSNDIEKEKEELVFVLDISKKSPMQQNIRKKLDNTSHVFVLEFNKSIVSDDCWEMLDSIEGFLANRCDGIIYTPDDGFFDKNLKHIYKL